MRKAVVQFQSLVRGRRERLSRDAQRNAATSIQARVRGHQHRRRAADCRQTAPQTPPLPPRREVSACPHDGSCETSPKTRGARTGGVRRVAVSRVHPISPDLLYAWYLEGERQEASIRSAGTPPHTHHECQSALSRGLLNFSAQQQQQQQGEWRARQQQEARPGGAQHGSPQGQGQHEALRWSPPARCPGPRIYESRLRPGSSGGSLGDVPRRLATPPCTGASGGTWYVRRGDKEPQRVEGLDACGCGGVSTAMGRVSSPHVGRCPQATYGSPGPSRPGTAPAVCGPRRAARAGLGTSRSTPSNEIRAGRIFIASASAASLSMPRGWAPGEATRTSGANAVAPFTLRKMCGSGSTASFTTTASGDRMPRPARASSPASGGGRIPHRSPSSPTIFSQRTATLPCVSAHQIELPSLRLKAGTRHVVSAHVHVAAPVRS